MDEWKELLAKAEGNHATVTRVEFLESGLSQRQLDQCQAAGRMERQYTGVYRVVGAPPTFDSKVAAAIAGFEPGTTWASHHTASKLSLLGIESREGRIEVVRANGLSNGRSGLVIHRSTFLPPHHVTTIRGIPVTSPARTIFDLARTTGPNRLNRAVTAATQNGALGCSIAAVYRVLFDLGGRGRPGTRRLRAVLERWDADEPPTESELDAIGRALLGGIPGIEWQVELSDETGYIRRVDGLVRDSQLVLEFDGAKFHDPPQQKVLDHDNDERLRALGYEVRRYRWDALTRGSDATLAEVRRLLRNARQCPAVDGFSPQP